MNAQPNVLLIVADCARSDKWLGEDRRTITPTVDRLVDEGVSFATTIAETSCTTPCFAGMLSGAYSYRHGVASVGGYCVADDVRLLPELLRERGYHTYMEATGPLLPLAGLSRGFDEYNYRVALNYLHDDWGDRLIEKLRGGMKAPWFLVLHLWELHLPRQITRPFRRSAFGKTPYERAVSSLDWELKRVLEAAGENTLTIFTGDHGEKTAEEEFEPGTAVMEAARLYGADRTPAMGRWGPHKLMGPTATQQLRARFQPRLEQFSQRETPRPIAHGMWRRLRDTWRMLKLGPQWRLSDLMAMRSSAARDALFEKRGVFDAEAAKTRLERVMQAFGEDELFDMYLRMWAGMLRLHLLAGHVVHVYDYLTRVPLVLHWPGRLPRGRRIERMVRQVDIAATICDLLDVPRDGAFSQDGQSLAPLIREQAWESRPAFLSVSGQPRDLTLRGVRTERHKFTFGPAEPRVPQELYDLQRDPRERINLASREPALCADLMSLANGFLPSEGARVQRLSNLSAEQQAMLEKRLRELGYVE